VGESRRVALDGNYRKSNSIGAIRRRLPFLRAVCEYENLALSRGGICRALKGDKHGLHGGLLPLLFAFDFHGLNLGQGHVSRKVISARWRN